MRLFLLGARDLRTRRRNPAKAERRAMQLIRQEPINALWLSIRLVDQPSLASISKLPGSSASCANASAIDPTQNFCAKRLGIRAAATNTFRSKIGKPRIRFSARFNLRQYPKKFFVIWNLAVEPARTATAPFKIKKPGRRPSFDF
jgi:hypothetical protein